MDDRRFDAFTKSIATRRTRRSFLKAAMAAGAGAAAPFLGLGAAAAPAGKVTICHQTHSRTNPQVLITVSQNALPAHLAHGDFIVDTTNDPNNCGACGNECPPADDQCFMAACVNGECTVAPNPGVTCDDGDPCTVNDVCDEAGVCAGTPVVCDPSDDPCLENVCDPAAGGCTAIPTEKGTPCEDGDLCTENDVCDGAGTCVSGTPIVCDDGDICTADRCVDGTCVYEDIPGCCTSDAECPAGQICIENVCTDNPNPICAGATCETFTPCNDNDICVCGSLAEGGGFCVDGTVPCDGLVRCPNGTGDCPAGSLCFVNSCCIDPVCVPSSFACPPPGLTAPSFSPVDGPTLGSI